VKRLTLKWKDKDWAKVTAIAQLSSSLLIGILGVTATIAVNRWQHQASEDQLALQKAIAEDQARLSTKQAEDQARLSTKQAEDQQKTLRQQFKQQQALAERQFSYQKQLDASKAEADAAAKVASYVSEIEAAQARQGYDGKASLVGAIDGVTDANGAVALAFRYAYPNKNENEGSNKVSDAALDVLKRERVKGRKQLLALSKTDDVEGDDFVRSQIATSLLTGHNPKLFLRVSDIKGSAETKITYSAYQPTIWLEGSPTGWVEMTSQLHGGRNQIEAIVNGNYSGSECGARLQISAGMQQYDRNIVLRACPANALTYRSTFEIDVRNRRLSYRQ
jgi:hypothetical protein